MMSPTVWRLARGARLVPVRFEAVLRLVAREPDRTRLGDFFEAPRVVERLLLRPVALETRASYDLWSWILPLFPLIVRRLGTCRFACRRPAATAVSFLRWVLTVVFPDTTAHPPSLLGVTVMLLRVGMLLSPPVGRHLSCRHTYPNVLAGTPTGR